MICSSWHKESVAYCLRFYVAARHRRIICFVRDSSRTVAGMQPANAISRHHTRLKANLNHLRALKNVACSSSVRQSGFAEGSTSTGRSRSTDQVAQTLSTLQELLQEAVRLSFDAGPQAITRGLEASQVLFGAGRQYVDTVLQGRQPDRLPTLLRKTFEKLGATYIKLGQFIASSPSLFPEEYVLEFQKCLDKTDPVQFEKIKDTIAAELGRPVEEVFSYIDPVPIASASVAQVHSAELRDSGKEVVLKVLKPGVEAVLRTDLNFLTFAVKLLQALNPELDRLSISGIVADIRASMLDEVDFEKEAQHIAHFQEYLERTNMGQYATCPYVYKPFSSKRLLAMDRIRGVPLTDLQAIRSVTTADPETTLINALNTWMGSAMACETFHADVHAGNLLVMADGRVAFLDFGIVGRVSPVTWKALQALAVAIAELDFNTMAKALATMKATNEEVNIDAFAKDLEVLFAQLDAFQSNVEITADRTGNVSASVSVEETQINRLLLEIVRIGEANGIRFPREFGLLVKQMLYFDRYIRLLAPELKVLTDSRVSLGNQPLGSA